MEHKSREMMIIIIQKLKFLTRIFRKNLQNLIMSRGRNRKLKEYAIDIEKKGIYVWEKLWKNMVELLEF